MISQLSIIIPTLNEEKYLPKLLSSIAKQEFQGDLQVIVADGTSDDETYKKAKQFEESIKDLVILQIRRGVSFQRNEGARHAKYEHLLFLDADVILPLHFLNRLAKKINPEEQCIDFIFQLSTHKILADYLFVFWMYVLLSIQRLYEPLVFGSFLLTTKTLHNRIGGFDEKAVIGEDVDYGFRAIKHGGKYHLHFRPYVYVSPRREYVLGRRKTFFLWVKMYFYMKRTRGPIYDQAKFSAYKFGEYKEEY